MGADIHMVLEKKASPRGTPVWIGVNAFPYMVGNIYNFGTKGKASEGEHVRTGAVHWTPLDRNYNLFGRLAGVRGEGPEPRGLPDDASDLALLMSDGWGEDGHSHTWFTMDEAMPIFIAAGQFGSPADAAKEALKEGNVETALLRYMNYFWSVDSESESLADYRLIIWFDN